MTARFGATRCRRDGIAPNHVGVRAAVHLAAALVLPALAFAVGRWLRDPSAGGPLLILLGAAILWVVAVRGSMARIVEERESAGPYRTVGDLVRVAGFGPSRVRGLGGRLKV